MFIFLPVIEVDNPPAPYVNEWQVQVVVDTDALMENELWATAWNHMDPEVEYTKLSPEYRFEAKEGWTLEFVNIYMIEDMKYYWWSGLDEEETCWPDFCVAQGANWFSIKTDLDIDVFIAKVKGGCDTCFPSRMPENAPSSSKAPEP